MARTSSEETPVKKILDLFFVLSFFAFASPVSAALNVFACEPEWGALAKELGGDKVSVYTATTALQDPHRIEARPSLIARIRSADLLICSGSELEVGWLPLLLTQSGNSRIQPGSPAFIEAAQFVTRIEIPKSADRSLGDIHPGGNPHVHTDARNIARVADVLAERLTQVDSANAGAYRARAASFQERWRSAIQRWEREGAKLRDVPVVVYHRDFSYFIRWMSMREVGSLEPKPGIPPTPAHLADLVERMKRNPAKLILYSPYNNPNAAQFLSAQAAIPAAMMPFTVGGSDRARDLFGLFDDTIARLLAAVK
jgi:zinc/manganese transport system substrate-binding protein